MVVFDRQRVDHATCQRIASTSSHHIGQALFNFIEQRHMDAVAFEAVNFGRFGDVQIRKIRLYYALQ